MAGSKWRSRKIYGDTLKVNTDGGSGGKGLESRAGDILTQLSKHSVINSSPAEVLYGRYWRNRLPDLMHTDEDYKKRMKLYADQRRRTRVHGIQVGDWVLLRKEKKLLRKTEPFYEVEPYRVIEMKESMISAKNQKRSITRNCSMFQEVGEKSEC